ncbi:MAG: aminopeptidase, partial [Gemmatimonadales bacterium]
GYEEAWILLKRRSFDAILADTAAPADLKQRLRLVQDARAYARDSLGFAVGETYTTYVDAGRDTLLLVLTASRRDRLEQHVWRYPIVGTVPYKGFFNFGAARSAAARLEESGLDTYLRPSGAFSTLGWFSDPLLSTIVGRDTMELVATVLHELAHNTLYVPNYTPFNESFANFAGYRAAEAFFRGRGDTLDARRAARRWQDEVRLDVFYAELARRLDSAYAGVQSPAHLEEIRRDVFGWARRQLSGPTGHSLETYDWRWFATRPLNNAVVIAGRIYRTNLDLFDRLYVHHHADIRETLASIQLRIATLRGEDPFRALYSSTLVPP